MIREKEIFWEEFPGYPVCVCRYCNSDDCDYDPETGAEFCQTCKRDESGKIHSDYPHKCPDCGWHVLSFSQDRNRYYPWECARCLTAYAGTEEGGPTGTPRRSLHCPTCGQNGVAGVIESDLALPRYYLCAFCDTEYHADRHGLMVQPEPCPACGQPAVQYYHHLYREPVPGGFQQHEAVVKRCHACTQLFSLDLRPVDKKLNIIADLKEDAAMPKSSGLHIVPRS